MPTIRSWAMSLCVVALALLSSGCATVYVNDMHKAVDVTQLKRPAQPQPTQLLFTFQTQGTANARVTDALSTEVLETVKQSGLFSSVTAEPVSNGSMLSVTINNVGDLSNAAAKGFATGLTLGLAGNTVTDGYVCTIDYVPATGGAKTSKTVNHAIHTTVGAKGAPPNSTKTKGFDEAGRMMTRQVVAAGLADLSGDPTFQ